MNEEQIEGAVADIGSDLFSPASDTDGGNETTNEHGTTTEATETAQTTETVTDKTAVETKSAEAAVATTRAAPKAWAKEQHERWAKLDKETQEYIELREKQALDGITQYTERAKRGDEWEAAVKPYMHLIQAQGAKPHEAVSYLFEAHRRLSSGSPEQRVAFLAEVAKTYGIDFNKVAAGAKGAEQELPAVKELRERTERLENDRAKEREASTRAANERIANEVKTFAEAKDEKGNLKHPYFDECADDIVALIAAGHTLDSAYEKAIWANAVTRAKEQERVRKADADALQAKAKAEAEKARNASRPNVTTRDTTRRATPARAASWEDGMDETLKEIKARQTH